MLSGAPDELTCDMAETYHVHNIKEYPVSHIAVLAAGLRQTSRVRMKMEGQKLDNVDTLMSLIFDKLNWLCWTRTKDAQHGRNRPESAYAILTGTGKKDTREVETFSSAEEFEKRRKEIIGENNG